MPPPRIAYFPDSFHEVNGVAHTSRNFVAYARRQNIPMLCVRAGKTTRLLPLDGSIEALELGRRQDGAPVDQVPFGAEGFDLRGSEAGLGQGGGHVMEPNRFPKAFLLTQ